MRFDQRFTSLGQREKDFTMIKNEYKIQEIDGEKKIKTLTLEKPRAPKTQELEDQLSSKIPTQEYIYICGLKWVHLE